VCCTARRASRAPRLDQQQRRQRCRSDSWPRAAQPFAIGAQVTGCAAFQAAGRSAGSARPARSLLIANAVTAPWSSETVRGVQHARRFRWILRKDSCAGAHPISFNQLPRRDFMPDEINAFRPVLSRPYVPTYSRSPSVCASSSWCPRGSRRRPRCDALDSLPVRDHRHAIHDHVLSDGAATTRGKSSIEHGRGQSRNARIASTAGVLFHAIAGRAWSRCAISVIPRMASISKRQVRGRSGRCPRVNPWSG
jgi:hypothetical protein